MRQSKGARGLLVLGVAVLTALTCAPAVEEASAFPGAPWFQPGVPYTQNFPDPAVLVHNGVHYAYGTSTGGSMMPTMSSTDAHTWIPRPSYGPNPWTADTFMNDGLVYPPQWAPELGGGHPWIRKGISAPGVAYFGGRFVAYYTVLARVWPPRYCISVAVSSAPLGPFGDLQIGPIVCDPDPVGSIDPQPFVDTDGTPYLLWKSEGFPGSVPTRIWIQRLTTDGAGFAGPRVLLLETSQAWEGGVNGVIENPSMVRVNGQLYLFYSGNLWQSANYAMGYATCATLHGPCFKYQHNPILHSYGAKLGPGGGTAFIDSAGRPRLAFQWWNAPYTSYPAYPQCEPNCAGYGQRRLAIGYLIPNATGWGVTERGPPAWGFETLDGAGGATGRTLDDVGTDPTVVSFGTPHVFSYDATAGDLRHGWWTGATWAFETLDGAGGAGGRVNGDVGRDAAAMVSGSQAHVFYRNASAGDLRHGWWTGSSWAFETLDGAGGPNGRLDADVGSDLAVDRDGSAHVWYRDRTNADLRHGWWTGSVWAFETLDGAGGPNGRLDGDIGTGATMTSSFGAPHIWYGDEGAGDLRHGWWTGAVWAFETLDGAGGPTGRTGNDVASSASALMFGAGPQVWYRDDTAGTLRHGWWTGALWAFETLDASANVGVRPMAVLHEGRPHVWYGDLTNGDLRHAWWNGLQWGNEVADGAGGSAGRIVGTVGASSDVALWWDGQFATIQVAYTDSGNGDLRHAWYA